MPELRDRANRREAPPAGRPRPGSRRSGCGRCGATPRSPRRPRSRPLRRASGSSAVRRSSAHDPSARHAGVADPVAELLALKFERSGCARRGSAPATVAYREDATAERDVRPAASRPLSATSASVLAAAPPHELRPRPGLPGAHVRHERRLVELVGLHARRAGRPQVWRPGRSRAARREPGAATASTATAALATLFSRTLSLSVRGRIP